MFGAYLKKDRFVNIVPLALIMSLYIIQSIMIFAPFSASMLGSQL